MKKKRIKFQTFLSFSPQVTPGKIARLTLTNALRTHAKTAEFAPISSTATVALAHQDLLGKIAKPMWMNALTILA